MSPVSMAAALWAQCLDKAARNDPHDHDAPIQQQARHLPSVRIKNEPAFQTTAHQATPKRLRKHNAKTCLFASFLLIPRYKPQKPGGTTGYWPFYPGFYTVFWKFDVKLACVQMTA
jgi:hypothetical protein